jgi:hypothetical protein
MWYVHNNIYMQNAKRSADLNVIIILATLWSDFRELQVLWYTFLKKKPVMFVALKNDAAKMDH